MDCDPSVAQGFWDHLGVAQRVFCAKTEKKKKMFKILIIYVETFSAQTSTLESPKASDEFKKNVNIKFTHYPFFKSPHIKIPHSHQMMLTDYTANKG